MIKKILSYNIAIGMFCIICCLATAQIKNGLFLKTNLTNLVFNRPTIAIEKRFNQHAIEISYVSGKAKQFIHYSDYQFAGGLLRYKKHLQIPSSSIEFLYGGYIGYLHRDYDVEFTRFYNNSYGGGTIRGGFSNGLAFYPLKGKMIIDFQTSVGYGRNLSLSDLKQYLDLQFWLSIGLKIK